MIEGVHRQRVSDLVRAEMPTKTIYTLISLNFALFLAFLAALGWVRHVEDMFTTQDLINAKLAERLAELSASVELGPRMDAIEQAQTKQTEVLEAIADRLGIIQEENERGTDPER